VYKLADQGIYSIAQNNLGLCHENGTGTGQTMKEAVRLYRLFAEQGYSYAQNNLGRCYENGNDVNGRSSKIASDQGYSVSQTTNVKTDLFDQIRSCMIIKKKNGNLLQRKWKEIWDKFCCEVGINHSRRAFTQMAWFLFST